MLLTSRSLLHFSAKCLRVHERIAFNYIGPGDKGAPQWWKDPVYHSSAVSPLQRGKDFSFLDGKKMPITSEKELQRRHMQVAVGKKIVQYLGELRQAEKLYEESMMEMERQRSRSHVPIEKGGKEIA